MRRWRELIPLSQRRWLRGYGLIAAIHLLALGTCGWLVFQKLRYRDVQHWPSVEATNVNQNSLRMPMRYEGIDGSKNGAAVDLSSVSFNYEVAGKTYQGSNATPEGGSLPAIEKDPDGVRRWRAFYHPEHPAWAVLQPDPYRMTPAVLTTLFLGGFFVLGNLFFFLLLKNQP